MLIQTACGQRAACDGDLCLEIGPSGADGAEALAAALRDGWREFGGNIYCAVCTRDELQICPDHVVVVPTYQI